MRARYLKPEFFKDKKMGALGPAGALVYEALWCLADDGGMAKCDPAEIKAEMFLHWSAVGVPEITGALRELSGMGRIEFYQGGDEVFAKILRWKENQPVHKPSAFRYETDYLKRGKALVPVVPTWCGVSAALGTHSSNPILLDSHTPGAAKNGNGAHAPDRRTHTTRRAVDAWVAPLAAVFGKLGAYPPSTIQRMIAPVVKLLGEQGTMTAASYYVDHAEEIDGQKYIGLRSFAQKAAWCLKQVTPMDPAEAERLLRSR